MAGEVCTSNSERDLAGRNQADLFWSVDIVGENCSGVGVGSNVESLHPS